MIRTRFWLFLFMLVPGLVLAVGSSTASTPAASTLTVPTTAGQTVRDQPPWTGSVQPGANAQSDCSPPSTSLSDDHVVTISVAPGTYDTLDAAYAFQITWTPTSPTGVGTNDLILTVIGPAGQEIGSSDGGTNVETVSASNLPAGNYTMLACGFANATFQPYAGKAEVVTTAKSTEPSLPSANSQGLAFSAAVPSDNQRDESEPLIEIDRAGNMYTCGPSGSSQFAEYYQVSTDGGDQFHLLGVPPRGQGAAGGGGDCALATGPSRNSDQNYPLAYAGLGPLTGFATAVSPDNGHRIATSGFDFTGGVTNQGAVADRQWAVFVDESTVLMSYNQQQPRNTVVLKSTDGGLHYDITNAKKAARSPRFPGPMRYIPPSTAYPAGVVYFGWDRGAADGDHINLSISRDRGATWTNCIAAVAPANVALFVGADHDRDGNIYLAYTEQSKFHTYMVSLAAGKVGACDESVDAKTSLPTKNPGFSAPVQVDRDAVRTTVFPWVTAGGAPGRVAVTFAGSETDGNPNVGTFKGSWDIYVNQSLNALDAAATFSQVEVTTHPFHYDSICLNGLGCDLSVPPGDRSLADFFAMAYNTADGKLSVVFNRGNKKPDEASGHVASPMVATQIGGPSNGGSTITSARPVVRSSSTDPTGDALSSYSLLGVETLPPSPSTINEPAGDFLSVAVGPEVDFQDGSTISPGGFTVTMKVADLTSSSLLNTATRTGSQSLLWVFRFTNGYQDVAASARWNPAGFTFGYNDYVTGSAPCEATGPVSSEKCLRYPGDTPLQGNVDQATGTIRLSVPRHLLRALSGGTGPGERPSEVPASVGSRFYDATAFSLGNTVSPIQDVQSFLYPFDNAPSMDFLLPSPGGGGGGGGGDTGCKVHGGGSIGSGGSEGKFSVDVHASRKGRIDYRDRGGDVDFRSTEISSLECTGTTGATIRGTGVDGDKAVTFTVTVTDGGEKSSDDTFEIILSSPYTKGGPLTRGNIQVKN